MAVNEKKQIVFRRSLVGSILLIGGCLIFTIIGVYMVKSAEEIIWGVISIVFFGIGGLLYISLLS